MNSRLRRLLAGSELFSFNVVRRDRWIARQAEQLSAGTKVLDVGAGSCPYRALFSHCEYLTQDLAPLRGDQLRHGGYGQLDYVSDLAAIPVPDGSFGAVLCTEVLEHHPEPIKVVHELARILAPGGTLILTAPLGSGIHQEPYHYYGGYTPWWYQRFLGEAGFDKVTVEPNEGSLRCFAQESLRFIQTTRPFKLPLPWLGQCVWIPMWLGLAPILGGMIPWACKYLDRFDFERRFTVGYHVTARRR
ncbi:MAG: Class I SAM-dependent methyltransferase [Nitrospira sp.]|nr:MAG: Class I SAM-dependent methyltransferase [Nitrospira sp.]